MSKIFYYGALREITGRKEEVFDIHDVKGCLASIRVKYGRLAYKEARRSLITLNGISIVSLDNYRTKGPCRMRCGRSVAYENTFPWECRGRLAIMPPIWYNG